MSLSPRLGSIPTDPGSPTRPASHSTRYPAGFFHQIRSIPTHQHRHEQLQPINPIRDSTKLTHNPSSSGKVPGPRTRRLLGWVLRPEQGMSIAGKQESSCPWCKVWGTLGQQPDSSSPSSGQGSASPGLTASPQHHYHSSQNLRWPHFSSRGHERTSRIPAAPKVRSLTAEMQHDSWHSSRRGG